MHLIRALSLSALAAALAACGPVLVKPDNALPTPLVQALPAKAALVTTPELRNYVHRETRSGSDWEITLGEGHLRLFTDVLRGSFRESEVYPNVEAATQAPAVRVIFEPWIEQFSFATARDTGGRYWAVTIRYRINVYTPTGERADSLTLNGYGSTLAKGRSAGALERASLAAMRDAAAKFLVQFPRQPLAARLARGEAVEPATPVSAASAPVDVIDIVPIDEPVEGLPPL